MGSSEKGVAKELKGVVEDYFTGLMSTDLSDTSI